MIKKQCIFYLFVFISFINAEYVFRFDGHTHCNVTPESPVTPQQTIDWHKSNKFTSMAITNHEPGSIYSTLESAKEAFISFDVLNTDSTFPIVPGMEWSSRTAHILIYWSPDKYEVVRNTLLYNESYKNMFWDTWFCREDEVFMNLAQIVHGFGGILGVAHYSLTQSENLARGSEGCSVPTLDFFYKQAGFDFIEVFNGVAFTFDSQARTYANKNNITQVTGTDIHTLRENYITLPTFIYSADNTSQGIFNAIKNGNTYVSFDFTEMTSSLGSPIIVAIVIISATCFFGCVAGCVTLYTKYCKKKTETINLPNAP